MALRWPRRVSKGEPGVQYDTQHMINLDGAQVSSATAAPQGLTCWATWGVTAVAGAMPRKEESSPEMVSLERGAEGSASAGASRRNPRAGLSRNTTEEAFSAETPEQTARAATNAASAMVVAEILGAISPDRGFS